MRPSAILLRWTLRRVGRRLGLHLLATWGLLGFVAVQAEAMMDVGATSQALRALPPGALAACWAALALAIAGSEGPRLRALLLDPGLGVLRRQPVADTAWSPTVAVIGGALLAPLGAFALLVHGPAGPAVAPLWVLAALPALVASAGLGPARAAVVPAVAVGAASIAAGHSSVPAAAALGALAATAAARGLGPAFRRWTVTPGEPTWRVAGRPRMALGALVRQDLLGMWRLGGTLPGALLAALPIGGLALALERNGGLVGGGLGRGVVVGLAMAAPLTVGALSRLSLHLGRQLDPPAWPVRPGLRAAALTASAAALLAPAWAAAAVSAPALGVVGHARIAVFVALVSAGAAWIVAAVRRSPRTGLHPWWILLSVGLAWPDEGLLGGPVVAAAAVAACARSLARARRSA